MKTPPKLISRKFGNPKIQMLGLALNGTLSYVV